MTIKEIYNLAIQLGKKADPRNSKRLTKILDIEKKKFESLSKPEKMFFDRENLKNPYSDSRYYTKNPNKKIKKMLVGIDIGGAEILLADRLNQKSKQKIDLVLSHHPIGSALASLDNVVHLQTDLLSDLGIPVNIAENLIESRVSELNRQLSSINHYREIDMAKNLSLPLMCLHTPADNMVYNFLQNEIKKAKPETVTDILKMLKEIPEYREAAKRGAGPRIYAGKAQRRCGKVVCTEITGGTSGAKQMYEYLSRIGVGTIVGMHMNEEYLKEAKKHHINVIIAGHIASDSLGMNLILDKIERKGIKIIPCSGLIRVKRK